MTDHSVMPASPEAIVPWDEPPGDDMAAHWKALREGESNEAREALFMYYLPYARTIASALYAGRHRKDIEFDDIVQLANIGLIEAIGRFDPARDVRFTTFCTPRVRGSVLNGIQKLSEAQEQLTFERRRRAERVESLRGEGNGAKRLEALGDLTAGLAIGFMLEGTGMFLQPDAPPWHYSESYENAEWEHLGARLREALDHLSTNERKVIAFHYFDALAFEQIAILLGLSKGRISQLHRAGLVKMRAWLAPDSSLQITG
jgi:RNA polymerase sigma factor FliA